VKSRVDFDCYSPYQSIISLMNSQLTVLQDDKPWLFQKGVSGNPKGRPRGQTTIGEYLREYLSDPVNLSSVLERIKEMKPDVLLHYAYGKPVDSIEISGPDGASLIPPELIAAAAQIAKGNHEEK